MDNADVIPSFSPNTCYGRGPLQGPALPYTRPPADRTAFPVKIKNNVSSEVTSDTSQRGIVSTLTKTNLTPSTVIFLVNTQAVLTIVCHSLTLVDHHMDELWVVEGLRLVPDDGERGKSPWHP